MDISIDAVMRLQRIFQAKNWLSIDGQDIIFERFCILLANLSEDRRELIFELVERYTWISYRDYNTELINVLQSIEKQKTDSYKKIYLFPVMKPEHEKKTKSGHAVLYLVNALHPVLANYQKVKFDIIESYDLLKPDKFKLKDGECILLIDDYLGSGETIQATIDEILKNDHIKADDLNIISIASQEVTVDIIRKNNISLYNRFTLKRGLSDFYQSPVLEEKISLMVDIEKMIPGGRHFTLGYNQSEALITMLRTPDNTFPIFWMDYRKDKTTFLAPFSRM